MLSQVVGSILCLVVAGLLGSVILQERESLPTWVVVLAGASTVMMIATAVRLAIEAKRRHHVMLGRRTKIVIAPPDTKSRRSRHSNRGLPSDD
jgi:hypothetical protein